MGRENLEDTRKLEIRFGCIADKISKQLKDQGFKLPKDIKYINKCQEAINQLTFLITDSQLKQLQKDYLIKLISP